MLSTIAIAIAILYLLGMVFLTIALVKPRTFRRDEGYQPTVTVIIAARNEEENIRACLSSLVDLKYPRNLLEIIVVDDRSTDGTAAIVREFEAEHSFLRYLAAAEPTFPPQGKANALTTAIERSTGEILMFTDADCTVPPEWIERTVMHFADRRTGIVGGFISVEGKSVLHRIQALDWLFLLSAASASARIGFPVTAVGNNFSVRRSAYEQTGGYRKIPFSVTEDFSLFQAVTAREKLDAVIPLDMHSVVRTLPCTSWRELFAQRRRWFVGGRGMQMSRVLAFVPVYLLHLICLFGFLLSDPLLWGGIASVKVASDLLLLLPSVTRFRKTKHLISLIPYELYLTAYVLTLPLTALLQPRVVWKKREFGSGTESPKTKKPFPAKERALH